MLTLQWSEMSLESLHEDIPEHLNPIVSIHNGQNDWVQMLVLYSSETKVFHWVTGYGCACCDNLYNHLKDSSLMVSGDAKELKRALRGFLDAHPDIITEAEKEKTFSKIKKQK